LAGYPAGPVFLPAIELLKSPKRGCGSFIILIEFNTLFGLPRWQNDYLELAHCHHAVFISDILRLDRTWGYRSRRFINLVNIFYDRKVKVVISADALPDTLYVGNRLAFELRRTASRLKEMHFDGYLETPDLG
jgi:cell division protein ZapE